MTSLTQVKICGITQVDDAIKASELGAQAIGLVFYPPSKRNIDDLGLAAEISMSVAPFTHVVALFVDAAQSTIEDVLSRVSISTIQFHGSESARFCESFDRPYIKALRMKPSIDVLEQAQAYSTAKALLLDAYRPGVPGGTGESFDWNRVPTNSGHKIILAGGLTAENVQSAIAVTRPAAVDVSGGVEKSGLPGIKDIKKIKQFIHNVQDVNRA